jgi:nitroreductase
MPDPKIAQPDHPIHELIAQRWSPYGYADKPVSEVDLRSLFEAARWAASSYNEQPWRYIVATKQNAGEFDKLLSCLVEGNQGWAKNAPVLALGCIGLKFSHNGSPNKAAEHDLGIASATLTLEATHRGLHVHQMIGILPDKAREVYGIPEDFKAHTALAIGYRKDPGELPDQIRDRDTKPRPRKPLPEIVFGAKWGSASHIVG